MIAHERAARRCSEQQRRAGAFVYSSVPFSAQLRRRLDDSSRSVSTNRRSRQEDASAGDCRKCPGLVTQQTEVFCDVLVSWLAAAITGHHGSTGARGRGKFIIQLFSSVDRPAMPSSPLVVSSTAGVSRACSRRSAVPCGRSCRARETVRRWRHSAASASRVTSVGRPHTSATLALVLPSQCFAPPPSCCWALRPRPPGC